MPDFRIVAVFTSTDPRDGGASWHQPLARNEDGKRLRALAEHLTGLAAAGRKAFHEGPLNRSFEDRHEALAVYERQVRVWFDVSLKGCEVRFRVEEIPVLPTVDLTKLDLGRSAEAP